jgi:heme a synthase
MMLPRGSSLSLPTAAGPPARPRTAAPANLRPVAYWLFCCCGMIFVMVLLGGITRLTLSGVSITEWQPLSGVIPPLSHAAWMAEFDRYKRIPQYQVLNAGMSLADFKYIFWWEYVHRLWGRLIGLAYALPLLWFLVRRRVPRPLALPLCAIFLLGAAQGALGWYMVESGLVHRIEVSQYRLVAHLALALAIYGATLWIGLGLFENPSPAVRERVARPGSGEPGEGTRSECADRSLTPTLSPGGEEGETASAGWRRAGAALVALVGLTICAGGFVSGLRAGFTYNTFPLMEGHFVPPGYARLHPFIRNWFENIAAVQFDHRLLAETTVAAVLLLWLLGRRAQLPRPARLAQHFLLAAVLGQFALGLATLLLVVPAPLAAAHQGGAVVLLTAAIVFRHTLRRPAPAGRLDRAPAAAI